MRPTLALSRLDIYCTGPYVLFAFEFLPLRRIGGIVEASPSARKGIGYTRDTLRRAPPEIRGGSPKWAARGRGLWSARRGCSA